MDYIFVVRYDDQDGKTQTERVEGTQAKEELGPGSLVVYDEGAVVARYPKVIGWSRTEKSG
jgi:hypothetical protein